MTLLMAESNAHAGALERSSIGYGDYLFWAREVELPFAVICVICVICGSLIWIYENARATPI
jgi:hypothetical protein